MVRTCVLCCVIAPISLAAHNVEMRQDECVYARAEERKGRRGGRTVRRGDEAPHRWVGKGERGKTVRRARSKTRRGGEAERGKPRVETKGRDKRIESDVTGAQERGGVRERPDFPVTWRP